MHTTALTKSAAAITLAALATFGIAACSSGGSSNTGDAKSSGSSTSAAKSTPKAGLSTKVQCAELNAKLSSSESGLESAMSNLSSSSDPSTVVPQLQKFQSDLHTQVGKVTDPALKSAAGKVDTDFAAMMTTLTTMLNDAKSSNAADAQAQLTKMQSQESALQSDGQALEKVCKL